MRTVIVSGATDVGLWITKQMRDLPKIILTTRARGFDHIADTGYELMIGGNGGIKLRGTDLLCKVETEDQAMEMCAAFIQFYREDAHYLERTAPWIERVGLDYVKHRLADPEDVRKYAARFRISQKYSQVDPWAERAGGDRADLHAHIAEVRPLALEEAL